MPGSRRTGNLASTCRSSAHSPAARTPNPSSKPRSARVHRQGQVSRCQNRLLARKASTDLTFTSATQRLVFDLPTRSGAEGGQKEAVAQLVKHHEASAAWVEVTEAYRIPDWQYREAEEGEQGGAGSIFGKGLSGATLTGTRRKKPPTTPIAPRKPKAAYSSVLCAYIAHHKSAALTRSGAKRTPN